MKKTCLALCLGNRGFFPETLIDQARAALVARLSELGFDILVMPKERTPYGAVESPKDGAVYGHFLEQHRGQFDGVLLSLPNFSDETGAIAALRDAGVPIFIHAWPDEIGKMGFHQRRDAFCGKLSVMDVFHQYGLPFTTMKPHVVAPSTESFAQQMKTFGGVCRIVKGMRRCTIGAIGARTTAFKTVRFDEVALEYHGITTETLDLSELFRRVPLVEKSGTKFQTKAENLRGYAPWDEVPTAAFENLVRTGVVLDEFIAEYSLDALALRCWIELEKILKISPCVLMGELNHRGIAAACELDVGNAVAMRALTLASGRPSTCLDWNNNYGDDEDKCILFHCGPVPKDFMTDGGRIIDHPMFAKELGAGCAFGCHVGRIAAMPMTYASTKTESGRLHFYAGEGEMTNDPIEKEFFGCAGVARVPGLQDKLVSIGQGGYRHHVSLTSGLWCAAIQEAFSKYLKYTPTPMG